MVGLTGGVVLPCLNRITSTKNISDILSLLNFFVYNITRRVQKVEKMKIAAKIILYYVPSDCGSTVKLCIVTSHGFTMTSQFNFYIDVPVTISSFICSAALSKHYTFSNGPCVKKIAHP